MLKNGEKQVTAQIGGPQSDLQEKQLLDILYTPVAPGSGCSRAIALLDPDPEDDVA